MGCDAIIHLLEDPAFLDKLYGFAYTRCSDSYSAQDLCSDIILNVLSGARRTQHIDHPRAYVWAVARRVYADFCQKRKTDRQHVVALPAANTALHLYPSPIDEILDAQEDQQRLQAILRKMAFLTKSYRDVMVSYYLDGQSVAAISAQFSISQTAVKQRLFTARKQIKEAPMKTDFTLKPMTLIPISSGDVRNDPRQLATRALSQNLIYLCRNQAKTAKELSETLNVPLPYVEEELAIQVNGINGERGYLRKSGPDRYIANCLILDVPAYQATTQVYARHLDALCAALSDCLAQNREHILNFPYLSPQTDTRFILWSLLTWVVFRLGDAVSAQLRDKYFADVELPVDRVCDFACIAAENRPAFLSYSCNGITGHLNPNDCGYSLAFVTNLDGPYMDGFDCSHDLVSDPLLMMTIRAIKGLDTTALTQDEREIAAKAIARGYLHQDGDILLPNIIVIHEDDLPRFRTLLGMLNHDDIAQRIADDLHAHIKRDVPPHLIAEYPFYATLAATNLTHQVAEACIAEGLLTAPQSRSSGEGVVMSVK